MSGILPGFGCPGGQKNRRAAAQPIGGLAGVQGFGIPPAARFYGDRLRQRHGRWVHGRYVPWVDPGYLPAGYMQGGDTCIVNPINGTITCPRPGAVVAMTPSADAASAAAAMLMPSTGQGPVATVDQAAGTVTIPRDYLPTPAFYDPGLPAFLNRSAVPGGNRVHGWGSPGGYSMGLRRRGGPTSSFNYYGVFDPTEIAIAKSSADSGTQTSKDLSATIAALSPAISTLVDSATDPNKRVAVLEAKIINARKKGSSASKIRILQAKLDAARIRAGVKNESLESTRDWRSLGKLGVITGIGIGAAIIFFILKSAFKAPRARAA